MVLFDLNDDELLPDLHITGAGVLRAGLGAHQQHLVNQDAQAADRKKVPAKVFQVASHEVDTDSDKDEFSEHNVVALPQLWRQLLLLY